MGGNIFWCAEIFSQCAETFFQCMEYFSVPGNYGQPFDDLIKPRNLPSAIIPKAVLAILGALLNNFVI